MSGIISQIVGSFVKNLENFVEQSKDCEEEWSIDAMEEYLRPALNELGNHLMKAMIQQKAQEAEEHVETCKCGKTIPRHRREQTVIYTTYGTIAVEGIYHYCQDCRQGDNPIKRLTGIRGKWRSRMLERALVDFGAEESFQKAEERFAEHYGFRISTSTIRTVTENHGKQALQFIENKLEGAVEDYQQGTGQSMGTEQLIIECDGCDIRTGELRELRPEERKALEDQPNQERPDRPRRKRDTNWKEVRLIAAKKPQEAEARYLAAKENSQEVGKKMFSLALLEGMNDNTRVHGLGDGAPWIAEEFQSHFPNGRFLLDKYHLIEHIYAASEGMKTKSEKVKEDGLARK